MSSSSEVLIIGAGLAGLNAAITLQNVGVDVQIVEASDRAEIRSKVLYYYARAVEREKK